MEKSTEQLMQCPDFKSYALVSTIYQQEGGLLFFRAADEFLKS